MHQFTWIGIILILLETAFVLIPALGQSINHGDVPSWLIYVYENGNLYFATSPILILVSALILILRTLI